MYKKGNGEFGSHDLLLGNTWYRYRQRVTIGFCFVIVDDVQKTMIVIDCDSWSYTHLFDSLLMRHTH